MPPKFKKPDNIAPDWKTRGAVVLAVGRWKMRNGKIVKVTKALQLPYVESATKKNKLFEVWLGECLCCRSPMTWNANGTYAATGSHAFDIIGKPLP